MKYDVLHTDSTGFRIMFLRKCLKLSQSKLAEKVGVSTHTVSQWECDKATVSIEKLIELSNLFECSTDYLLCQAEFTTIELEAISLNTGLSETAIKKLQGCKGVRKSMINGILSSDIDLVAIIDDIVDYDTMLKVYRGKDESEKKFIAQELLLRKYEILGKISNAIDHCKEPLLQYDK